MFGFGFGFWLWLWRGVGFGLGLGFGLNLGLGLGFGFGFVSLGHGRTDMFVLEASYSPRQQNVAIQIIWKQGTQNAISR